jgi:hypothetical protein
MKNIDSDKADLQTFALGLMFIILVGISVDMGNNSFGYLFFLSAMVAVATLAIICAKNRRNWVERPNYGPILGAGIGLMAWGANIITSSDCVAMSIVVGSIISVIGLCLVGKTWKNYKNYNET